MWRKALSHKTISALFAVSFLFVVGGFSWAYFALRSMGTGPFILHFNDIEGITQIGSLDNIIFMGVLGFAAVLMNFVIVLELEDRDRFLGKLATALTLAFAILLFIAFAAILNVN